MPTISNIKNSSESNCARRISALLNGSDQGSIHDSIADVIYQNIVKIIFNRQLSQGQRLTESSIAKEYQVSSIPVREALFKLQQDGWIEKIANKGSYVNDYREQSRLKELYLIRKTIEIGTFYNLSQSVKAEQLAHMDTLVAEVEKAYRNKQLNELRVADGIFHCTAVNYASGRQMEEYFEQIFLKLTDSSEKCA